MTLQELIIWLESQPPSSTVAHGFGEPKSYRGHFDELAFEPVENAYISDMLMHARSAVGKTFHGFKGGEFTMNDYTPCWIASYGESGDQINKTLVAMWSSFIVINLELAQSEAHNHSSRPPRIRS